MKTLSIKHPWAWLIMNGGKDIENRTWGTKFRGRFLIHASKQVDNGALMRYSHLIPDDILSTRGHVIGSVELVDVVVGSDSIWFDGPKGFVLKDPAPLAPFPVRGQMGFFEVDFLEEK